LLFISKYSKKGCLYRYDTGSLFARRFWQAAKPLF
jgi:hypothetical protein